MRRHDLILAGGTIVDGTGSAGYRADLAISDGCIVAIGSLDGASAERIIDVTGRIVAPGFIDIHSHSDFVLPLPDQGDFLKHFVRQGITTIVVGNCGYAPAPINPATADLLQAYTGAIKPRDIDWQWRTFGGFLDYLDAHGVYLNTVPLAAHGALRIATMGFEARAPRDDEMREMKGLLEECLDSGAFGVSCGLIYAPGMFATTGELTELGKVTAPYDGIFAFHVRGSSETLIPAANEVIEVAQRSGVRVQHSHLEAFGKSHWPKVAEVLEIHEQARRQGIDHGFDVIPYTAANTTFLAILPPWSLDGGVPKLLERLRHAETRAQIRRDIETVIPSWPSWEPGGWPHNLVEATGWDNVWVIWVASRTNKACEGKSVARLAAELGKDPFDVAADLILEERGQILALYIGVSGDLDEQWALRQIVQHPSASVETDAFSLGHGKPNPALVGSFPRILGQYVRDERLMTFADAIHKMTALSAERLQIPDRGVLCEGAWADITVVDAETVGDHSTYLDPDRPPSGIDYVLINGIVMVDQGETDTTTFAGQVLRAQGRR